MGGTARAGRVENSEQIGILQFSDKIPVIDVQRLHIRLYAQIADRRQQFQILRNRVETIDQYFALYGRIVYRSRNVKRGGLGNVIQKPVLQIIDNAEFLIRVSGYGRIRILFKIIFVCGNVYVRLVVTVYDGRSGFTADVEHGNRNFVFLDDIDLPDGPGIVERKRQLHGRKRGIIAQISHRTHIAGIVISRPDGIESKRLSKFPVFRRREFGRFQNRLFV